MSRFAAAFGQMLRDILRDRYAVASMIGAVVLYSVFYPAAYRNQVASNLPVAVVDQDHGALSRDFRRRLDAVRGVRIAGTEPSLAQARRGLEQGRYEGLIVIPAGFERDLMRGVTAHLVVQGDGAYLSRGSNVVAGASDAITAAVNDALRSRAKSIPPPERPPFALVQRPLFNTREGYGSGVVPGVAELIVHQTVVIGIGVVLGGRRRALGRRLCYGPAEIAGMLAATLCIGLPALLYYSGFTFWVQDYPRGGNLYGLLVASPLFVSATGLLGMTLGSFFSTRERAFQCVTAVSLVLFFLSNLTWPWSSTPPALRWLAGLLPTTSGINALVAFNQMGASLEEASGPLLNLLVLILLYGALSLWRFRSPDPAARTL